MGALFFLKRIQRWILGLVFGVPLVLLIRLLRPLRAIRIIQLYADRIGHFAANTEIYLCERDAGLHGSRIFDIFYYNDMPVSNGQLKKMWDRTLLICSFAKWIDLPNRLVPGSKRHTVSIVYPEADTDRHGLLHRIPEHLSFTLEEERAGQDRLRDMGIPDGAPFACMHARDSAYLTQVYENTSVEHRYHDYRDSSIRHYVPAAEELARRGYFMVRMGAVVEEALNTENPRIIDYAATGSRTDFMDIYLGAKCCFFLCDGAGICAVSMIFRRPIAYVNYTPLKYAPTRSKDDLLIPKKLWLIKERRFVTFREMVQTDIFEFFRSDRYQQRGIEVIENTPEEITEISVEMHERLQGTWGATEEDEELQRRFWSLFNPHELQRQITVHIGAFFLRQNQDLLD